MLNIRTSSGNRLLTGINLRIRSMDSVNFNTYPAGIESDWYLPPVKSQASLYICAVRPGSILLADQLQVLLSLKMLRTVPKMEG